MTSSRWYRLLIALTWGCSLAAAALLFGFRRGLLDFQPRLLAGLVAAAAVAAAATCILAALHRSVSGVLLCAGLLLILGGGLANWLYSLQGFAVLTELEAVPLREGRHLQGFEEGPLADLAEMDLTLQLERLDLAPAPEGFVPRSRIRLVERGRPAVTLETSAGAAATARTLRFHQGSFGFAPRIVITRHGEALFDQYVPLLTERRAGRAVSFSGSFEVAREKLSIRAALDLAGLDERMKGHALLGLAVERAGRPLGAGELQPGHFATLPDGYAVGFAGLKRWSEIDIARRNYPQPIFLGAAVMLTGVIAFPLTRRRR